MREIIESDFFIREKIDKRLNRFGIWWLRLITKNFHIKLERDLKKRFSNNIEITRNAFQYEWETYNFGQYYTIKIVNSKTIYIWFGYDYSKIVNSNVTNKNSFFIAVSTQNFYVDGYKKIKRYRRTGYTTMEMKTSEFWNYKNLLRIGKKYIQNELFTVIEQCK